MVRRQYCRLVVVALAVALQVAAASQAASYKQQQQSPFQTMSHDDTAITSNHALEYSTLVRSLQDNNETTTDSDDENKPWGEAIGAALVVNLATLVGLAILIPSLLVTSVLRRKKSTTSSSEKEVVQERRRRFLHIYIPSFACGALLATAVFLIIPESLLLIYQANDGEDGRRSLQQDAENGESQLAYKFGTSVLGGFMLPIVLGSLFPTVHDPVIPCPECQEREAAAAAAALQQDSTVTTTCANEACMDQAACTDQACVEHSHVHHHHHHHVEPPPPAAPINYKLAISLLLGDAFHNFCDGIFLGNAFLLCSRGVAYAIAAATIYHELAQELADYFLLTTHVGLSPCTALCLNFTSGLSVMVGVVIILSLNVSVLATGCILAVSAGVYLYIAASECLPLVEKELRECKDRVKSIACVALGAVPIGLVLLSHGHCDA